MSDREYACVTGSVCVRVVCVRECVGACAHACMNGSMEE